MEVAAAAAGAQPDPEDDSVIKEGDFVVFDEHGDWKSLVVVTRKGRAKVGKSHIDTGDLIGARWGSSYTLSAGSRHLVAVTEHEPVSLPDDAGERDNRHLVDHNASQALTSEDIEAMKASGQGGGAIIDALCKHSTTFQAKTDFAQDKYKRRKARKYLTRVTLHRPTGWNVCQVMFDKSPNAVWNMRPDSLGLLLCLANVGAGARCLVLENCQGLVSGAVAELLGGVGALCCLGTGGKPAPLSLLNQMNLRRQHKAAICAAQLADLLAAAQRRSAGQQAAAGDEELQQLEQQQRAQAEGQQLEQQAGNGQQQQPHMQEGEQQQAAGNGAQEPPTAAAAAGSCAAAAVEGVSRGSLGSRSIPVVAAAAAAAAVAAVDTPDGQQPADEAAGAGQGGGEDDLDALYDTAAPIAAAAGGGGGGEDKKRRRSAGTSSAQQQQQQQQKRARQQQVSGGGGGAAADGEDTDMADADADADASSAGAAGGGGAAAGGGSSAAGPPKEGRVRHLSSDQAVDQLLEGGLFNSLILAAPKLQPASMLQQLLPLLAPSSPFVVFSPWVQPLAEAMAALTASRGAVMLQLQETWLRPYQVLPGRTHPLMALTTGGTGGYILSGITVAPDSAGGGGGADGEGQPAARSKDKKKGRGGKGKKGSVAMRR